MRRGPRVTRFDRWLMFGRPGSIRLRVYLTCSAMFAAVIAAEWSG